MISKMIKKDYPRGDWHKLSEEDRIAYNQEEHGISTSHYIRNLPPVPNAIRGLQFHVYPVRA